MKRISFVALMLSSSLLISMENRNYVLMPYISYPYGAPILSPYIPYGTLMHIKPAVQQLSTATVLTAKSQIKSSKNQVAKTEREISKTIDILPIREESLTPRHTEFLNGVQKGKQHVISIFESSADIEYHDKKIVPKYIMKIYCVMKGIASKQEDVRSERFDRYISPAMANTSGFVRGEDFMKNIFRHAIDKEFPDGMLREDVYRIKLAIHGHYISKYCSK